MKYLRAHWRGELSLAWSFWVNLVLLRALILWLEGFSRPPYVIHPVLLAVVTVAYVVIFHGIVYAWQIVGVLRAGDRLLKTSGSSVWTPAANVGVVVSLAVTSVSIVAAAQMLLVKKPEEAIAAIWGEARAQRYSLAVSADGRTVSLAGDFELGLTRDLAALLRDHPDVDRILLRSSGGYVTEGRGVARLIRQHGLRARVEATCESACATAFVGGASRSLGADGRIGFHQYWVKPVYAAALVDPMAEQAKDRRFFAEQGVAPEFLERVFDAPHEDIWFPTHAELLEAGVAHWIGPDGAHDGGG